MLHKRKRLLGLILAGLLLLPAIPAAAEYTLTQGAFYLNEADPIPCRVLGYDDYYGGAQFQYVPIANALGYTTTYDGETQTITSEKDGRVIRMVLNQSNITITENGQETSVYGIAREYEGSTYLRSYIYNDVFDIYAYQGETKETELYLYTKEAVAQRIENAFKSKQNTISDYQLPETFTAKISLQTNDRIDSDTFGIHINGSLAADITLSHKGEWTQLDATINADGLANFIRLFAHPAVSEDIKSLANTLDLEKPVTISMRYNSDTLYVKADNPYVLSALYSSLPWMPDEYKNALPAQLQDKWIGYTIDDSISDTLSNIQNSLQAEVDMTQFADYFASSFGKTNHVFRAVDALAALSEKYASVTQEGSSTTVKADLPDGAIQQLLREFTEIDQSWLDVLKLSCTGETTITDKHEMTSSISLNVGLTNIPTPYGLQCGTADGTISATLAITEGAEDIAAPENTVSFESLYDEADAAIESEE